MELVKDWEAPHPMCEVSCQLSRREVKLTELPMRDAKLTGQFCHQAFFGPDELFKHMRERHEECFVCRQMGEKNV